MIVNISQKDEMNCMHDKNISDVIEKYLKKILANERQIEISRSDVANLFNVVPSQINYVIKTRFTIPNGYLVASKRGGGGYIRIEKVRLLHHLNLLDVLSRSVGNQISQKDGNAIIKTLCQNGLLDSKTAKLLLATVQKRILYLGDTDVENAIRARIILAILNHLRYER